MNATETTLLILGIILGLYILTIALDAIFILSFRRIFKKHNTALCVMLHTKYENIKKLVELLNKAEVAVPFKYIEILNGINANSFKDQELPECVQARNDLAYLKNELVYMVNNEEKLTKNLEVKRAKDAITEMDANYRTLVSMYNADALGYNYWINFLPTKWVKYLFRLKEKTII